MGNTSSSREGAEGGVAGLARAPTFKLAGLPVVAGALALALGLTSVALVAGAFLAMADYLSLKGESAKVQCYHLWLILACL